MPPRGACWTLYIKTCRIRTANYILIQKRVKPVKPIVKPMEKLVKQVEPIESRKKLNV